MLRRVNIVCFYWWAVTILIAVLRYLSLDWNICNIEIPAILVPLLKVRHFEMSAILKCPPSWMDGHIVFWSYCNLFSKWYLGCLVMLLLQITVNLSHSDNDFTWIVYFIISVVWTSSFKLVWSMPWCSSIYHLGIVISFGIWFDGKPPWWLWDIHIQSWCLLQVPAGRLWSVEWCESRQD